MPIICSDCPTSLDLVVIAIALVLDYIYSAFCINSVNRFYSLDYLYSAD